MSIKIELIRITKISLMIMFDDALECVMLADTLNMLDDVKTIWKKMHTALFIKEVNSNIESSILNFISSYEHHSRCDNLNRTFSIVCLCCVISKHEDMVGLTTSLVRYYLWTYHNQRDWTISMPINNKKQQRCWITLGISYEDEEWTVFLRGG